MKEDWKQTVHTGVRNYGVGGDSRDSRVEARDMRPTYGLWSTPVLPIMYCHKSIEWERSRSRVWGTVQNSDVGGTK